MHLYLKLLIKSRQDLLWSSLSWLDKVYRYVFSLLLPEQDGGETRVTDQILYNSNYFLIIELLSTDFNFKKIYV